MAKNTKILYTSKQNFSNVANKQSGGERKDAEVDWRGDSQDVISGFPLGVKQNLGYALRMVQQGLTPPDVKIMRTVGDGCFELRDQDERAWYRVIYRKSKNGVIRILHCFEKQTNQTEQQDINTARKRLSDVVAEELQEKRNDKRGAKVSSHKRKRS
ncbi:MAG TPA: type II toxin-antitoxin system RelE/ParE family toxin [Terriglobales bacterium]